MDCLIIGSGPAGYTAALYAARAGLDTLVIERMSVGGQMALTGDIENYPGFDEGIDGFTLGMKMKKGAERFGAKTKFAEVKAQNLHLDMIHIHFHPHLDLLDHLFLSYLYQLKHP